MTTVAMEKDGATIDVDTSQVTQHKNLGWGIVDISNDLANVDIAIGAEDTDVINVAITAQDSDGATLAESLSLMAYLSDDADGLAITATAPDGGVVVGTDGGCIPLVVDKFFLLNLDAGLVDLDIEESSTGTWYLVIVFPNGERVVSDAITFA